MLGEIEVLRVIKDPVHLRFLRIFRTTALLTPVIKLWTLLRINSLMHATVGRLFRRSRGKQNVNTDTQPRFPVWYWPLLILVFPISIPVMFWEIGIYYFVEPRSDVEYNSPWQVKFYARITMSVLRFFIRTMVHGWRRMKRGFKITLRILKGWIYTLLLKVLLKYHRPLCFSDYYLRARRALTKRHFDVYHAHDLNTLPLAWWMARATGAKLVYDSHEYYLERNMQKPYGRFSRWWRLKLEGFLLRRCQLAITVNESIAEAIGKRYDIAPLKVIRNTPSLQRPVDAPVGDPLREILKIDAKIKILIYVGAITFNRGLKQLISAMQLLPECVLVFMGPGSETYKKELLKHADLLGIVHRLYILEAVRSDLVTTYAACADIGVAPIENKCLSYYYCSPNKVYEYVLAGIPVIASDFPELRKVVEDYGIGMTFNPDEPENIARAARAVLDDPAILEHVRRNMKRAATDFNWEIEATKLTEYYRELMGSP